MKSKIKHFFLLFTIFYFVLLSGKIIVIAQHYNNPLFIELQNKTFKYFLKDEYEFIIFNDASDKRLKNLIDQTCLNLGLKCFRVPPELHFQYNHPSDRHADGLRYAMELIGFNHDDIVMIVDSDVFLLKPFSIREYLQDNVIAGKVEARANSTNRIRYISPILMMFNIPKLPEKNLIYFKGGTHYGLPCDNGAQMHYYLKKYPQLKIKFFNLFHTFFFYADSSGGIYKKSYACNNCSKMTCASCVWFLMDNGCDDESIEFIQNCPDDNIEFVLDHTFIHYRGGSNWDYRPEEYHRIKTNALIHLINEKLKKYDYEKTM